MVSLDTVIKAVTFLSILTSSRREYFWTGGILEGPPFDRKVVWPNGVGVPVDPGSFPWGSDQPDGEWEDCVAAVNVPALFGDGARLRDELCNRTMAVLCQ